MDEARLLEEFRKTPSRESLQALLLAHQQRVYNACYQVLGRPEDAEDAAQGVLLKLADGARAARDADSFRGWIYRVSLRAAIDLWRRRDATRARESRAAMNRPAAPPLDDRDRIALFEAMENLEDGERSLVLEHYFEKVPLEDLGARRGVSSVAIWKRIDKAREKLKKLLLAGGFVAASAGVADALESSIPAAVPPLLIAKALAGGLAMGISKGVVTAGLVTALLIGFGLGAGTVYVMNDRATPRDDRTQAPLIRRAAATTDSSKSADPQSPAVEQKPAPADPAPAKNELRERLLAFKAWFETPRSGPRPTTPEESTRRAIEQNKEARRRLAGVRELVFQDPQTFLDFICEPGNERVNHILIGQALHSIDEVGGATMLKRQSFSDLPSALVDGFRRLLESGPAHVKSPILDLFAQVDGTPEEVIALYRRLMKDSDPGVQASAITVLGRLRKLDGETMAEVRRLADTSSDRTLQRKAIQAIAQDLSSDSEGWLLDKLESNQDAELSTDYGNGLMMRMYGSGPFGDSKSAERHAKVLATALANRTTESGYYSLIACALLLPVDRSAPILQSALPMAPNQKLSDAVSKVLESIQGGEEAPKALVAKFSSTVYPSK